MSAVRLSDRQACALLALAGLGTPAGGAKLAEAMTGNGRETGTAGAHQAANGLADKGLVVKGYPAGATHIRYTLTDAGRKAAAGLRG